MDAHTPSVESISLDQISLQDWQPSGKEEQPTGGGLNKFLGNTSGKLIPWQEAKDLGCGNEDGSSDIEEILSGDHSINEAKSALRCFRKDEKWPNFMVNSDASSDEDEDENFEGATRILYEGSDRSPYSHAIAITTPSELVSAMKGSRNKHGSSEEKTVTWSPDVYDPLPTVLSDIVVRGQKQQKSKKDKNNGNKQKGDYKQKGANASKWGSGKDKKQLKKMAGSSKRCYKSSSYNDDYDDDSNW